MCSMIDSGEKGYKLPEQILFNSLVLYLTLNTLFLTDRFIHQSVIINTHFSPYPLFFGTSYQLISSWFLILTPLKQE